MPFPRPGRALKVVLVMVAVIALAIALLGNWIHPPTAKAILAHSLFSPDAIIEKPWMIWTLATSGLITLGLGQCIFTLIGLYFLSTDLERRWGGARFIRFLLAAVVLGNLVVLAFDLIMPKSMGIFHPDAVFGAGSAIAATAIAWSRMNAHQQVRLMFFIPVSGRMLMYFTLGYCVLGLVFASVTPEGAMAPFGGVAVGYLLSSPTGQPSSLRTMWLKLRLAMLRRKGAAVSVEWAASAAPAGRQTVVAGSAAPCSVPERCAVPAGVPDGSVAV